MLVSCAFDVRHATVTILSNRNPRKESDNGDSWSGCTPPKIPIAQAPRSCYQVGSNVKPACFVGHCAPWLQQAIAEPPLFVCQFVSTSDDSPVFCEVSSPRHTARFPEDDVLSNRWYDRSTENIVTFAMGFMDFPCFCNQDGSLPVGQDRGFYGVFIALWNQGRRSYSSHRKVNTTWALHESSRFSTAYYFQVA